MPASPTTWTTGNLRETKYNSEKTHLHYHESLKHHIVLNCHSVPARGMRADLERYPGMDLRQAHQSVSARKSTTAGRYATIMMMTPICGAAAAPRGTVASPRATDLRPPPPLSQSFLFLATKNCRVARKNNITPMAFSAVTIQNVAS